MKLAIGKIYSSKYEVLEVLAQIIAQLNFLD